MYLLEFGVWYLASLLYGVAFLLVHKNIRPSKWFVFHTSIPILLMATLLSHSKQKTYLPTLEPGFYYSRSNSITSSIAQEWPKQYWTYDKKATPWILNGDMRTGLPFLLNDSPELKLVRR